MSCASPRPGPRRVTKRRTRVAATAFLLLALLATAPAVAGWWDDAADARETTLSELRQDPSRWRDVPVLLEVRFGGAGERLVPYFTQFTPECWQPVTLLPRDATEAAGRELRTAFVPRGGRDDLRLARISPNLPVQVRGVVRHAVDGEPWLEILAITIDGDALTPEESTRVREADRFLELRNPVAAERLYRRVLDERRLADRDRAELLRKIGVALHDQERPHDALASFREALALDPDDLDARHRATHLEDALARVPLAPSPEGVPPTAGSAARPAPEQPLTGASAADRPAPPEEPLLLPGGERPLAPPKGLAGSDARDTAPPRAAPAPPRPDVVLPATKPAPTPAVETKPAEPKPAETKPEEPEEDEPAEDAPPPVPKPPRLSGPK